MQKLRLAKSCYFCYSNFKRFKGAMTLTYELLYHIAQVRFLVQSDFPLSEAASWQLFAEHSTLPADFIYRCKMHSQLPQPLGENVLRFYDHVKERYYSVTEEFPDSMTIHLAQENLPWGSEISQLYEQLALPHMLLKKGRLLIHSSCILTPDGAIVFTAPSGTGKSTQAELWRQYLNALIVNGDRSVVGLSGGNVMAYGFPLSGSSNDCLNRTAKLRAIVSLKQAKQNTIRRLSPSEAIAVFINGSYLSDDHQKDLPLIVDAAIPIAQKVPIYELSCLPDEGAVALLEKTLAKDT